MTQSLRSAAEAGSATAALPPPPTAPNEVRSLGTPPSGARMAPRAHHTDDIGTDGSAAGHGGTGGMPGGMPTGFARRGILPEAWTGRLRDAAGAWRLPGARRQGSGPLDGPRRRVLAVVILLVSVAVAVTFALITPVASRPPANQASGGAPAASGAEPQPPAAETPVPGVGDPGDLPPGQDPTGGPGVGAEPATDTPAGQPGSQPTAPPEETGTPGAQGELPPGDLDTPRFAFPISPAAGTAYGRTHHDYAATDIFAPCGARVVSPVDGIVLEITRNDRWNPAVDDGATRGGLSVTLLGVDGVRYYGSHLASIATGLRVENVVRAGQRLGTVGHSGSARNTSCHLHFGISPPCGVGDWAIRRGVIYPWPYLDAWRRGEQTSPARAVERWLDTNPRACEGGTTGPGKGGD
jgi:murein DD-endopeptidase MepM/ murein hydrolase activator NlpD